MMWILTDDRLRALDVTGRVMSGSYDWHLIEGEVPRELYDENGVPAYKLVGGQLVERTREEREADIVVIEERPTVDERVDEAQETADVALVDAELALAMLDI